MKSTAKQENKFNFKRNSYIPKMCVDPSPWVPQHIHIYIGVYNIIVSSKTGFLHNCLNNGVTLMSIWSL